MSVSDKRRDAERRGRRAEAIAAWFLRLKGYRVLARRYRTPAGEIDLIVRKGKSVVFVEVKGRTEEGAAIEAVTPASRKRIAHAAALWVSRNPAAADLDQRFDVVLTLPGRLPRHLSAVFDSDGDVW
jgi:putative endonuclease